MNYQTLVSTIKSKKTFLCVGLDPDLDKLPKGLPKTMQGIVDFNKAIIDATAPYCVAYKPNIAFYECYGAAGWEALQLTLNYLPATHLLIADAKRADIGNTSARYAATFFNTYNFDAITLNPYMGADSIAPFLAFKNKWSILLALTSNAGATDFQLTKTETGHYVYEQVIQTSKNWATHEQLMYVVGATKTEHLQRIRAIVPEHFLLVPGVGAQGGSLHEVCKYGLNDNIGLLINNTREILYASANEDYAEAAAAKAHELQIAMQQALEAHHLI